MMLSMNSHRFKVAVMTVATVFLLGSLCGCANLRRKFVRKKKVADGKEDIMPVLQPEEYQPRAYSSADRYREHYAVMKGYFDDLWNTLGRDANGKREQYLLSQIEAKLNAMAGLLPEAQRTGLQQLSAQVRYAMKALDTARALRRYDVVNTDLKTVEREVRRKFKPDVVVEFLK